MNKQTVGAFIREARKEKGYTQAELAHKLHVSDKAVSKWERGESFPDIVLMEQLAKCLEVSLTELYEGEKILSKSDEIENTNIILEKSVQQAAEEIIRNKKRNNLKVILLFSTIILILSISTIVIRWYQKETAIWSLIFSAKITNIEDELIIIQGIPTNDEDHRGTYYIDLAHNIMIKQQGSEENVSSSLLQVGDDIQLKYEGPRKLKNNVLIKNVKEVIIVSNQ